ncbi:hypothetical protein D9M69_629050 [compost metagenome]
MSWVRSFEPIEKPSKNFRNSSGSTALLGTSHIMISLSAFSPRFRPCSPSSVVTRSAWPSVRTKGTMICTLVRPMSLRTRLSASHSMAKASPKSALR